MEKTWLIPIIIIFVVTATETLLISKKMVKRTSNKGLTAIIFSWVIFVIIFVALYLQYKIMQGHVAENALAMQKKYHTDMYDVLKGYASSKHMLRCKLAELERGDAWYRQIKLVDVMLRDRRTNSPVTNAEFVVEITRGTQNTTSDPDSTYYSDVLGMIEMVLPIAYDEKKLIYSIFSSTYRDIIDSSIDISSIPNIWEVALIPIEEKK